MCRRREDVRGRARTLPDPTRTNEIQHLATRVDLYLPADHLAKYGHLAKLFQVEFGSLPEIPQALLFGFALGVDVEFGAVDGIPAFDFGNQFGGHADGLDGEYLLSAS